MKNVGASERSLHQAAKAINLALARKIHQLYGALLARLEAHRRPRRHAPPPAAPTPPVDAVPRRLAAMRPSMRGINMGRPADESLATRVGMTGTEIEDMYRLLAIAKYDERYVIPPAHAEQAHSLEELATECSLDLDGGPGMGGAGPFGEGSGAPTPIAVENFQMLRDRQTSDTVAVVDSNRGRVNLLNWDGRGRPDGLFPRGDDETTADAPGSPGRPERP